MKSGEDRDKIAEVEDSIAFEMEGAGVWDHFPCIFIKGACDYADSHKSKVWQRFAAATAVACTKAFLSFWVPSFTQGRQRVALVGLGGIGKTQIALQLAFLVKKTKPDYSVFWMPALSMAGFEKAASVAAKATVETLLPMHPEDATGLLEKSLIDKEELTDSENVSQLLDALTYLPLAIAQAAAYMNVYQTPIVEYIRVLNDADAENAIELLEQGYDDEERSISYVANVVRRNRLTCAGRVCKAHSGEAKNQHKLLQKPRAKRKASQQSFAPDHKRMLSSPLVQTFSMFKPEGYQGFVDQLAATLGSSFTIAAALSSFKSTESAATHQSATIASIDYPKPAILRKRGSEVRVENMRRDLTGNGLMVVDYNPTIQIQGLTIIYELFEPNDRGGCSSGAADMTFEMREGVEDALRQIQGANTIGKSYLAEVYKLANGNLGHPIKSTPLPSQGHSDTANREPFTC
ncbi:hypothetical protein F25303_7511 [Fusarium sp. NRRL 25303]|nr:hypothetical protein F25303_7511 [Fusarium sp. NRRL 25303]